ncbi:MAG: hypothetical protein RLZZ507_3916 [Cyanobacteriota bacterium]|jgi:hypothetical protein
MNGLRQAALTIDVLTALSTVGNESTLLKENKTGTGKQGEFMRHGRASTTSNPFKFTDYYHYVRTLLSTHISRTDGFN